MKVRILRWKRAAFAVLFTLLLSVAGVTNALAQTFTVGNLNYSLNDDGVSVTVIGHVDGTNATGTLVIPESVTYYTATYAVTIIANNAFSGCSGLTGSLIIPESVTSIGESAFYGCSGFTGSLTIPNAVTSIGSSAFMNCTGFTGSLTIGTSLHSTGLQTFRNCSGFSTLNYNAVNSDLMGLVELYGDGRFYVPRNGLYYLFQDYEHWLNGCTVTSINIGDNVQTIPHLFLYGCSNVTGNLVIPETVTSIGGKSFANCIGITGTLIIHSMVASIGSYAFENCFGFTALDYNAVYCTSMKSTWLSGVTSLTSLSIGESVQRIPDDFVNGKSSITGSLTIPNSVTYIGTNAFTGCTGFSGTLTLGQSVSQIGNSAFFDACAGFTSFNVLAETPPTLGNNVFISADYGMPVSVPCGSLNAYQNASGWDVFTNIQEPDPCMWEITAIAVPTEGGTVSGAGTFEQGQTCTLTATAFDDYIFSRWLEDGVEVSTNATYSFTVEGNRSLVAHFDHPTFTVTASPNPTNGGMVTLYSTNDFEDATISSSWINDVYYPWNVSSSAHSGSYCIKSGNTNIHSTTSSIETIVYFPQGGSIAFYSRISSESCCDKGRFYIDDAQQIEEGGNSDWTYRTFNVAAGYHTFRWSYSKDSSVNTNEDSYFIDDVTFGFNESGVFLSGETCVVAATPYSSYTFEGWTENGNVVSTDAEYSFIVTSDRELEASFAAVLTYTITATSNPGEGGTIEFNLSQSQYDFDDSSTQGWTTIDADGDGYNWVLGSNIGGVYLVSGASLAGTGHNASNDMMCSGSYSNATGQAISPDNYLVSPQVALGGSITFWACAQDASYAAEHFAVAVSTTDNTSASAFTNVQEWTMTAKSTGISSIGRGGNTRSQGNWYQYSVDLSAYSGYGYVAIRHFNCYDQFVLNIDDININQPDSSVSALYPQGSTCTVTATPYYGYSFENWTENSNVVSTDAQYSFIVTEDRNLVANFVTLSTCSIVFDFYDSYGDGWNGNRLVVSDNYGFYQELTIDGGSSATYTLNMIDGSHITLGWIYGSWTGECSYTVHFENGYQIFEGSQNIGLTGEFDFNCDDAFTPVAITAVPNFDDRGTVTGAGEFVCGEVCTLTATPNEGHLFSRWTENGVIVSTEATYSFTVTGLRNLVAVFTAPVVDLIVFADDNVKAICVNHWDTDGDGELTYAEAAAVTNLGGAFSSNQNITSFDELQYFTGLTYINDYEFYYCTNLTSIVIPENVTSIGYQAFLECYNLGGTLTINENVTYIGWGAFYYTNFSTLNYNAVNCEMGGQWLEAATSSLTTLTIGESVEVIPYAAFQDCYNVNGNLIIPNSVTYIGEYAFNNCHSLTSITIPEGITSIEQGTFAYCSSAETINLPSTIENIGYWAFGGCSSLVNIVIPNNVLTIGDRAFEYCSSLTGILELPFATSIGGEAFVDCSSLTGLILSDNIQSIGYYAFKNCSGLRGELTLPESLESVGGNAFYGCDGISVVNYNAVNCQTMGSAGEPVFYDCAFEHIRIGENVQNIPNYAFKHCFLVTDIASAPINPPTIYSSTFGMVSRNIPVSVPLGSSPAYRTAQYWEEFFHITEDYSSSPYTYHWSVNVHQFADNMTVTGIIQIEGVEQAVPSLEIGAFCNGECRGRQLLTYYPQVDRYLVFLMLYGEEGDMFTFRLYDHEAGEELTAGCASVITFESDAIVGSFLEPYVFNFTDMQLTQFSEGWNWWSTYVEQEGIDGLSLLEEGLGENGVTIRSQVGYTDYYEGYGWYGSLAGINNESSYKIKTSAPCVASMAGGTAIPSQHPITLNQGWTWMGYLPSFALDINAALDGLEAAMGDKVKSQQGYSDYYPGYGWFGSLNTIEPGMGLMYYSSNGETITFTYPDGNRGGELRANHTSENNYWKPNVHAYPDNMTVMAVVELNDEELNTENYELAAFTANGECRGSVKLTYAEPLNRHVAFLTVSGKDAVELSFRLYDTETGMEYFDVEESLDFIANAIVGEADDLYTIHFKGTTGMDEFAGRVKVYPNPVNVGEQFSIGLTDDVTDLVRVEIINTLGMVETVHATSRPTLTAPKVAGVYMLRITVEGKGTAVRKLVVK